MRRPNAWIAVPSLAFGAMGGVIAAILTNVSCRVRLPDGSIRTCPLAVVGVGLGTFLLVGAGMAVVLVLVFKSLAEWRDGR